MTTRIAALPSLVLAAALWSATAAAEAQPQEPSHVTVTIQTTLGSVDVEVFTGRAPLSAGDFLRYVDAGLYDGAGFYRVVRRDNDHGSPAIEVVQGGLTDESRSLPPVAHETTRDTGITHRDGTLSLARGKVGTGSAAAFFVCVGDQPALDFGGRRNADGEGFAAFGRVVRGMDVVRKIHAMDATGGSGYMEGQILEPPVKILRAWRNTLDYDTPVDPALQTQLERIDAALRAKHGLGGDEAHVGVLDLKRDRLAMIGPDAIEYAASLAKVGILLAWFETHREPPDATTLHELGMMAKASSNEMASKFSRQLGIREVQRVIEDYGLYDESRGGGLWFGKHYGPNSERIGDPVANHSHAATVRQLLRFWLLLDQGKLVSPAASQTMRDIFASPAIRHDDNKFVRGLAGRDVQILRKWGSWQKWLHDSALVIGPDRRYVLVGLTTHPCGDDYLADLASAIDDLMKSRP